MTEPDHSQAKVTSTTSNQPPKDMMGMLQYYLVDKAPIQIPANAKEWIVKYGPWIDLVLLVISAPLLLAALGLSLFILPFSGVAGSSIGLAWILLLVQLVLQVAALPGLFARKLSGWNLAFYSVIVSFVANLLRYDIVGGLIAVILGSYLLFQIRSYYK